MRYSVIKISLVIAILFCSMSANAETYSWTDSNGVVNYTDDPRLIPAKYRTKAKKDEDITINNPKVRQELNEQEERARQEEMNRPRIQPTPDYVPPKLPPVAEPAKPSTDDLPPGRSKSQRIRDNIERREAEENAKALEENKQ